MDQVEKNRSPFSDMTIRPVDVAQVALGQTLSTQPMLRIAGRAGPCTRAKMSVRRS